MVMKPLLYVRKCKKSPLQLNLLKWTGPKQLHQNGACFIIGHCMYLYDFLPFKYGNYNQYRVITHSPAGYSVHPARPSLLLTVCVSSNSYSLRSRPTWPENDELVWRLNPLQSTLQIRQVNFMLATATVVVFLQLLSHA